MLVTRLSGFEQYSGDEWQELCLRVLHEHHQGPELIEVPDDDRGDAGLEAFSLTGCAYQCYAPEGEPLTTRRRYEKQRNKMTKDVGKFVNNAQKIKDMLPPELRISHWVLLVPHVNTRKTLEHAAKKTIEVRDVNLPYASCQIVVSAQTLDSFEGARQAVIMRQLRKLDLPPVGAIDYSHINDERITRMNTKLAMTAQYSSDERRRPLINRLLTNHTAGGAHRDHVKDQYSVLGDQLEDLLRDLEDRLTVEYALDEPVPDRRLRTVLKATESVVDKVLNTQTRQSRVIAEGQVADWLMRCPLDFV